MIEKIKMNIEQDEFQTSNLDFKIQFFVGSASFLGDSSAACRSFPPAWCDSHDNSGLLWYPGKRIDIYRQLYSMQVSNLLTPQSSPRHYNYLKTKWVRCFLIVAGPSWLSWEIDVMVRGSLIFSPIINTIFIIIWSLEFHQTYYYYFYFLLFDHSSFTNLLLLFLLLFDHSSFTNLLLLLLLFDHSSFTNLLLLFSLLFDHSSFTNLLLLFLLLFDHSNFTNLLLLFLLLLFDYSSFTNLLLLFLLLFDHSSFTNLLLLFYIIIWSLEFHQPSPVDSPIPRPPLGRHRWWP